MLLCLRTCRRDRLSRCQEDDTRGADERLVRCPEADAGKARDGRDGRGLADDRDAAVSQVKDDHERDTRHHRDHVGPGMRRSKRRRPRMRTSAPVPRASVHGSVSVQRIDQTDQFVEDAALHRRHAKNLGSCPTTMVMARTDEEPGHDGLGQELRDEAQAQHARSEQHAHDDREGGAERQGNVPDRLRRRAARRRRTTSPPSSMWPSDLEMAASTEDGVQRPAEPCGRGDEPRTRGVTRESAVAHATGTATAHNQTPESTSERRSPGSYFGSRWRLVRTWAAQRARQHASARGRTERPVCPPARPGPSFALLLVNAVARAPS